MPLPYERMRTLRSRSGLSMRSFAARLGAPLDTRYAYYEERRFTGLLPIDAARRIAAELEPFGVDPSEVLELAGLTNDEASAELNVIDAPVQYVRLDVALPDAHTLTRMFEAMLDKELSRGRRDALARRLALGLPAALQRASVPQPVPAAAGDTAKTRRRTARDTPGRPGPCV